MYREAMEARSGQVMVVTAGGEAVREEDAKAELEAKAQAAHRLVRAKAYAHLLTRVAKAVACADLQVSDSKRYSRTWCYIVSSRSKYSHQHKQHQQHYSVVFDPFVRTGGC